MDLVCVVQERKGVAKEVAQRLDDPRTSIYLGASTTYESFGVECIASRLKEHQIKVCP